MRDPNTFKRVYTPDVNKKIPVRFFVRGFEYRPFGLIPMSLHLIGVEGRSRGVAVPARHRRAGRDLWSRLMYGTQTSLIIGLVGVSLSLLLGSSWGDLGLYGGILDTVIQRVIEILRSIPTIPLWMGWQPPFPTTGASLRSTSPSPSSSR